MRLRASVLSVTFIFVMVVSSGALAQGSLPFTGTRTFCGDLPGTTAIISIRKDGFTSVKTNIYTEGWNSGKPSYVTFSGKLNAKGILKRNRDYYLKIKSETDIVVYVGQDFVEGKPCK
jgi:hypothetical protein